jgi:hypothetical protein
MIKMIDTPAYRLLWTEAQQWIQTNIREIAESDLESEDLASRFVRVAAAAYYTNIEDYSPGTEDPLGLRGLQNSPELETLLSRIKATDRHEYAKEAIRQHYKEAQKAS